MFRTMQTSSAACALCAVAAGGPALDGQPGPGGRRVLGQGPSPVLLCWACGVPVSAPQPQEGA